MVNINQLMPYTIGFDRMFDMLQRDFDIPTNGYPPYNIKKDGDYKFSIEIALAGFSKEDIEVKVAEGELSIKSIKDKSSEDNTLYKGIAHRKFNRVFTLAENIEVKDAELNNGMLTIKLEKIIPEEKKPRTIKIN